ncbi:putative amidoligase enzyme-domain-containing protein [Hypoxylon fuscum]|nr:putative amidoligase enzyme-domain-containing protein [Hypoxylon fuscum]
MSSKEQECPQARPRTFGVELEFLIAWLWDDEIDPHQDMSNELATIYRIPRTAGLDSTNRNQLFEHIREMLREHGLPTTNVLEVGTPYEFEELTWDVYSDLTIREPSELDPTVRKPSELEYKWIGVEVVSSPERASSRAFENVHYAVNLIKSKYRCAVNRTCGLHVHVGDGPEVMPLEHIRRIVGLFWAADPLLSCLHPRDRGFNPYSPSIRELSSLSQGTTAKDMNPRDHYSDCLGYRGGGMRHGESPMSWRRANAKGSVIADFKETRKPGRFDPFFRAHGDESKDSKDKTPSPPLNPSGEFSEVSEIGFRILETDVNSTDSTDLKTPRTSTRSRILLPLFGSSVGSDIGVFAGVRETFDSPSTCVIQWLLQSEGGSRPNYNISSYTCQNLYFNSSRRFTIEFRQAEGTLCGKWVEVWARICVGLTHFAIHAPVPEYLAVLHNLNEAFSDEAPYDVIDLLNQVGLFAEATFAEKRLRQYGEELGVAFIHGGEQS